MLPTGERLRANVWGRYYVTDECDGCGICAACVRDGRQAAAAIHRHLQASSVSSGGLDASPPDAQDQA